MSYSLRNRKSNQGSVKLNSSIDLNSDSDSDSCSEDEFLELVTTTLQESRQSPNSVSNTQKPEHKDSLFVIDKLPGHKTTVYRSESGSDSDASLDEYEQPAKQQNQVVKNNRAASKDVLVTTLDTGLDDSDLYITNKKNKSKTSFSKDSKNKAIAELMKKSVISSDLEKKHAIPPYQQSLNQLKKQRRQERDSTKGKNWFGMKAAEMTEEKKNDLQILHMRRVLDPKRFYKGPDMKGLPKFFEMGRVVETSAEFYSSRIPKKQRKRTLADELLADAQFRKFNKRKYTEIQEAKKSGKGVYKHMKRLKKKKK